MVRLVFALALLGAASGCSSTPTDETPSGALTLFLEAMSRSEWDRDALRDAYELLSPAARESLTERARMANTLSGRSHEPWEMLSQGRFRLRFAPRRQGGMIERIEDDGAVVVVAGARDGERAEVPMVREGDRWRVALELPSVADEEP